MKKVIYVFILVINCSIINAQNVEFKKKNFDDQEGFEKAMNNIKKGDQIFNQKLTWLYPEAIEYYLAANDFNPNNDMLNLKLGVCYVNSGNKAASLKYFLKAYSCNSKVDTKIKFAIAKGYHYNMEWDKAIEFYNQYKAEESNESIVKEINKKIQECDNGKLIVSNPIDVEIINLGPSINTKFRDYLPITTKDEGMLLFTSGKESSDDNYMENIYYTYKNGSSWSELDRLSNIIPNIDKNYATVNLSIDGKVMFFYNSLNNNGDIYKSNYVSNKWTSPEPMSDVNSFSQESSACLSANNQELYFISDREGSIGGSDIFYCKREENGKWSNPINLGSTINTEYNEESVFILADGNTLLFSSQGHNSIGGYDIFKTVKTESGWSTPENLGYPFNSPDDEVNIFVLGDIDNLKGYYASVRPEGYGDRDIYRFSFIKENVDEKTDIVDNVEKQDTINLTDVIYTDDTNDASSYFVDVESNENNDTNNDSTNNDKDADNNTDTNTDITDNTDIEIRSTDNNNESVNSTDNNDKSDDSSTDNNSYVEKSTNITESWKEKDMSQENVVFNIQLAASRKPMGQYELHSKYKGNMSVREIQHEGWYKYLIGEFSKYQDAKELQNICGVSDAWVVTNKNNVRVNIREIMEFYTMIMPFHYRSFNLI